MLRRPPRSTRPATLFPYTPLFRSGGSWAVGLRGVVRGGVDVSRLVVSCLAIGGFLLAGVVVPGVVVGHGRVRQQLLVAGRKDRKSVVSGKSGSVRVDFGGRPKLKQNKVTYIRTYQLTHNRLSL